MQLYISCILIRRLIWICSAVHLAKYVHLNIFLFQRKIYSATAFFIDCVVIQLKSKDVLIKQQTYCLLLLSVTRYWLIIQCIVHNKCFLIPFHADLTPFQISFGYVRCFHRTMNFNAIRNCSGVFSFCCSFFALMLLYNDWGCFQYVKKILLNYFKRFFCQLHLLEQSVNLFLLNEI